MKIEQKGFDDKILVYSSWPYINADLHLGRLIGSFIPADCYRRLLLANNKTAVHYSGLDCYGEKNIEDLEQRIKIVYDRHLETFRKLDIVMETYGSTSEVLFKEYATNNLLELEKKGKIKLKNIKAPYCPLCGIEARNIYNHTCTTCGSIIIETREKRRIIKPLYNKPNSGVPYEEVERNMRTPGLLSPFSLDKKIWVWIEALHGYSYLSQNQDSTREVYFYGIDNEYFHKSLLPVVIPKTHKKNKDNQNSRLISRTHYVSQYLFNNNVKMSGSLENYFTLDNYVNEEAVLRLYLLSYNLSKTAKNFDSESYVLFKKWVLNKIVPTLNSILQDSTFSKIYKNLFSLFNKTKTFSSIVRVLQEKSGDLSNKENLRWINCIIKILSPGLFNYENKRLFNYEK